MSEIPAAVAVVEPSTQGAPGHVVETVNHHTPDPVTPPVVEHVPDPPRPDTDGIDQLRETVGQLATAVAALTDLVTKSAKDESPVSVPWTHRGSPVHRDDES